LTPATQQQLTTRDTDFGTVQGRDAEDMDPAGADLEHEEHIQALQEHCVDGEEVAGQEACGLGSQEGAPGGVRPPGGRIDAGGAQDAPDR